MLGGKQASGGKTASEEIEPAPQKQLGVHAILLLRRMVDRDRYENLDGLAEKMD
jgi:hypothetical protein